MHTLAIGTPGFPELIVILIVLLLLFGGTRLPQLAKGLGKSISEFKKGIGEGGDDDDEEDPKAAAARRARLRAAEDRVRDEEFVPDKYTADKPR